MTWWCEDCAIDKDVEKVILYSSELEKGAHHHLCQKCIAKRNKANRRLTRNQGQKQEVLIYQNGEEMVDLPPEKRAILVLTCYEKNDCTTCNHSRGCSEHRGMIAPVPLSLLYRWIDACCRTHEGYQPGYSQTCNHRKWCQGILEKRRISPRVKPKRGPYYKRRGEDYPK